jgi:N-methylhydantoinase B
MNHSIERMFDHGESIIRTYFEAIPDGYYVGRGRMDSDGITDDPIDFEVGVQVEGSDVCVDFTNVPDARRGPVNCPLPSTVSASRVAISMLAGAGEAPHEGYFRPLEVKTRPGSMFHPLSPSPCFLYGWAGAQSMEVIYDAVARALPQAVPACSGGDVCALVWWGNRRESGEPWADGFPTPVGQGASVRSDGASGLIHHSEAATRLTPVEVWETKNPWLLERVELATDSGGPGRHQGGMGIDFHFTAREDAYLTSVVERTKTAPWGLEGGGEGRANAVMLDSPEGTRRFGKTTRLPVPAGATVRLLTGGGGGYGPPAERDVAAVHSDIREGYISEAFARTHYPHTFEGHPKGESAS